MSFSKGVAELIVKVLKYRSWAFWSEKWRLETTTLLQKPYPFKPIFGEGIVKWISLSLNKKENAKHIIAFSFELIPLSA